eukprot:8069003-Ditylum_brightwellii.AAC.1
MTKSTGYKSPKLPHAAGAAQAFGMPGAGNSPSNPVFIQNAKEKVSTVINFYSNITHMSEKDWRSYYKDNVMPEDGFKKLDINIANSKWIIKLLSDLAVTYR